MRLDEVEEVRRGCGATCSYEQSTKVRVELVAFTVRASFIAGWGCECAYGVRALGGGRLLVRWVRLGVVPGKTEW